MGSKANNSYDEDMSNGDNGNDTSLMVHVNDTQSEIDEEHEESHRSESENHNSSATKISSKKESTNASTKKSRSNGSTNAKRSAQKETKTKGKVDPNKTRYLWVSGIPDGTKTAQLEELFLQYGKVLAIKIIRGGANSTLLGFVKLETVEQASKCMEKLNKIEFRGNKIELFKERPVDKSASKKPEKIGFRDSRKSFSSRPAARASHRLPLPHSSPRGPPPFRAPKPKPPPVHHAPPRREHHEHARIASDIRRQEKEELLKLEREKERLKLERLKLERDKAELLKLERESQLFTEREQHHHHHSRVREEKRTRSGSKRSIQEKPFEDFSLRNDFSGGRHFESSRATTPERKPSSGGRSHNSVSSRGGRRRYEDGGSHGSRPERGYADKYESSKSWTSDNSWASNDNHRWQSSSYDSPRIMSSSAISSSSISRIHSSSDIPQNISSRSYFSSGSSSRRY